MLESTFTVTGYVDTGTTHTENCLTCGKKTRMAVVRTDYVGSNGRRGSFTACGPHCARCAERYRRGVLPVHPFWFRNAGDGVARWAV